MFNQRVFLIDPPPAFAPRPEWAAFLAEMEALLVDNPGNEYVEREIRQARTELVVKI
jgi:hypothetical protein